MLRQTVSRLSTVHADRRRVGVLFHPRIRASQELAHQLIAVLEARGAETALLSAWDEAGVGERLATLDWVITMGGDGTLVRMARLAAEHGVPLLGVNFGQLGFLAELVPEDVMERVPEVLSGEGWIDARLMLRCTVDRDGRHLGPIDAVNDVFVGRGRIPRAIRLRTAVDGVPLARLTADGLLVATPTGSTAYSLSAGGPVVAPQMDAVLVTPVMSHPMPVRAIVLPVDSVVDATVEVGDEATLSIDGQIHHSMAEGDSIHVEAGPHRVRLLRLCPSEQFFGTLFERLHRW